MAKKNITEIFFLNVCLLGFASVIAMDTMYWKVDLLKEGLPNFGIGYSVRSAVIAISTIALFLSLFGNILFKRILGGTKLNFALSTSKGLSLEHLTIAGGLSLSIFLVLLFVFDAPTFSKQSLEDKPLEWVSAIFLFVCAIIFASAYIKSLHLISLPRLIRLSLIISAIGFFLLAMEEISWFQRVLNIETPKAFEGNLQHEMNLHNFKTGLLENVYYFGSFLFLLALPFVRYMMPQLGNNQLLNLLIARPYVSVVAAIACAYNFDMWNILFTQIAFVGSLLILSTLAIFSIHQRDRYIILFATLIIAITQIVFLLNGEKFTRLWEITEYKEFMIAMAYLIYSFDVYSRFSKLYLIKQN